jgi:hypothetical protein
MSKILCRIYAAVVITAAFPMAAQAQIREDTHFGTGRIGRTHFDVMPLRYYGGIYRGQPVRRGSNVWPKRYDYYHNWRQSYSPYWGWDVAAGLLASGPAYYVYYGVGYGDEYGYEAPDAGAIAYCMQRFRSYDLVSGSYLGPDGYRHPCP